MTTEIKTDLTEIDTHTFVQSIKAQTIKYWHMKKDPLDGKYIIHFTVALTAQEVIDVDAAIAAYVLPAVESPLDIAKRNAKDVIDHAAGMTRARYITIAPGQDLTYAEKNKDAHNFKNAGYPADETGYEFITAEKNATGVSATVAADTLVAVAGGWKALAANIEEIRIGKKIEVDAAVDIDAVQTVAYNARVILDNI